MKVDRKEDAIDLINEEGGTVALPGAHRKVGWDGEVTYRAGQLVMAITLLPKDELGYTPEQIFDANWRSRYGYGPRALSAAQRDEPLPLKALGKSWPGRYLVSFEGIRISMVYYLVGNRLFSFHYRRLDRELDEAPLDGLVRSFQLQR
jgi:hypothetical protein